MSGEIPDDARLEIKFVAPEPEIPRLLQWLKLHPSAFSSAYPDRIVNNVYFDSESYIAYTENLSGVSRRSKVRYRWYGECKTPNQGALEIKCKRNMYGWKLRYVINETPYVAHDDWSRFRRRLNKQIPAEGKKWLMFASRPVLINRYQRMYFVSSDNLIRVTIDKHQAVWDQRYSRYPNFHRRANLPSTAVMEIKFDRKDFRLAMKAIQTIPVRVSRHSKYVVGINAIANC